MVTSGSGYEFIVADSAGNNTQITFVGGLNIGTGIVASQTAGTIVYATSAGAGMIGLAPGTTSDVLTCVQGTAPGWVSKVNFGTGLVSVGAVTAGTWQGTVVASAYIDTGVSAILLADVTSGAVATKVAMYDASGNLPISALASAGYIKIGSYTGNGADNRSITGVGFQPDWIWVSRTDSAVSNPFKTKNHAGDSSYVLDAASMNANMIQALEADGFQVGTHNGVNANGGSYDYLAIKTQ